MILKYMNADETIGNMIDGNHTVVVEPGHPLWDEFVASSPEPYAPPAPEVIAEETARRVRAERDQRLAASDWTQLADASVSRTDWAAYRQALRNVPEQDGFPLSVDWPTPPT